ncbi:MAG: Holliday junction branch migration protein RuvA [Sphingomonadales bacterium]
MIAKLKGLVDSVGEDWVIVDVGGVGYLVFCSSKTLRALPAAGGAVSLIIETHVREDHIHLYGFMDDVEREWFGILQSIQGVGTRVALGILSVLPPAELAQAIAVQDRAALSRANGVGPKLAARLVNELKDKAAGLAVLPAGVAAIANAAGDDAGGATADAVSALVNLGYRRADAVTAIAAVTRRQDGQVSASELVREGLKELSR